MSTNPNDGIDRETIELARSGDETAISLIVSKYHSYLLFIANDQLEPSLTGRTSPSDVVQDTIANLPKAFAGFSGDSEPELRAWLRASLCNTLKNTQRYHVQQKRSVARELKLPSSDLADALTPSKELQSQERLSAVENLSLIHI